MKSSGGKTFQTVTVRRMTRLGIAYAIASLVIGFTVGLFRLFMDNGTFYLSILLPWYQLHSIFLIFGFLGALLMTERLAGSADVGGTGAVRFNAVMLLISIAGMSALSAGWGYGIESLRISGALLLTAGSLMFTSFLIRLGRMAGDNPGFGIMASGTVSLAISAMLIAIELPNDNLPLIIQMLLFPIMFVIGERIELTRFTGFHRRNALTSLVHTLSWIAIGTTALSSIVREIDAYSYVFPLTAAVFLVLLIAAVTLFMERKRKTAGAMTELQAYVGAGISTAYFWLFAGITLFLLRINGITGLYDAAIHAVALGFIATFIFAHGPVIFPVVLGRKGNLKRLTFVPLYILTISNSMRVFGDVAKTLASGSPSVFEMASGIVSLSGIVLAVSVVAFAVMMKRIMTGTRKGGQSV